MGWIFYWYYSIYQSKSLLQISLKWWRASVFLIVYHKLFTIGYKWMEIQRARNLKLKVWEQHSIENQWEIQGKHVLTLHGESCGTIQCIHRSLRASLIKWNTPWFKPIWFIYISKRTYKIIVKSIKPRGWKGDNM